MLNGKVESWIEVAIIVDGHSVSPEPRLVGAVRPGEIRTLRRRLLDLPCAKSEGRELADGDIMVDFHRDEPGEDGGVEQYFLDPVAFTAKDALEVLPPIIGIPRAMLLGHIKEYAPTMQIE